MYGCESWIIKKAELWRIEAFELWCWRRLLDCNEIKLVIPKINQSWIFIGRTDAEAEPPILWPPDAKNWFIWKRPWCWERLRAGGEGDNRGWDGWMASPTLWTWVWASSWSWWWTGKPVQGSTRNSVFSAQIGIYAVGFNHKTALKLQ